MAVNSMHVFICFVFFFCSQVLKHAMMDGVYVDVEATDNSGKVLTNLSASGTFD